MGNPTLMLTIWSIYSSPSAQGSRRLFTFNDACDLATAKGGNIKIVSLHEKIPRLVLKCPKVSIYSHETDIVESRASTCLGSLGFPPTLPTAFTTNISLYQLEPFRFSGGWVMPANSAARFTKWDSHTYEKKSVVALSCEQDFINETLKIKGCQLRK